MTMTITQRQLRNDSAAVLRAVEAGEEVVVTRNGTPVAELRPVRRRIFVGRAELVAGGATLPRVDRARLMADLDDVVDQDLPVG